MTWLLVGLAFGFVGRLHCVGMCAPLALKPGSEQGRVQFAVARLRLRYNLGRPMTYTALGGPVGAAGRVAVRGSTDARRKRDGGRAPLFDAVSPLPERQTSVFRRTDTRAGPRAHNGPGGAVLRSAVEDVAAFTTHRPILL